MEKQNGGAGAAVEVDRWGKVTRGGRGKRGEGRDEGRGAEDGWGGGELCVREARRGGRQLTPHLHQHLFAFVGYCLSDRGFEFVCRYS